MRTLRVHMQRPPRMALLLALLIALMMVPAPTHAANDPPLPSDGDVGGPPGTKSDGKPDRPRWPFADVTAPPRAQQQNGSNCEDEETVPATCGYYARSSRGCSRPRTCRACLEMPECMVNQFGACVNLTARAFEPALDYHKAFALNLTGSDVSERNVTLRYHFPASNATYCSETDATCLECKRTVFAGDVSDSRFCVGENNCICIASCETTRWEQLAGGLRCGPPPRPKAFAASGPPRVKPDTSVADNGDDSGGINWREMWTMGGIPAVVVLVGLFVVRSHRVETRRRTEAAELQLQQQQGGFNREGESNGGGGSTETTATSSRRLNLAGWQAARREPNKKENALLEGAQDLSPKHHFVDLLDIRQSVNPQMTILAAPVMGAVVVEASAPPMSPQHGEEGMEPPSAPSFDSDFEYEHEPTDRV